MQKSNLQVRVSLELDAAIEELAPGSKSDFVRQAIEEKIRREKFKKLEAQWVKALAKDTRSSAKDRRDAEQWLKAESWDEP